MCLHNFAYTLLKRFLVLALLKRSKFFAQERGHRIRIGSAYDRILKRLWGPRRCNVSCDSPCWDTQILYMCEPQFHFDQPFKIIVWSNLFGLLYQEKVLPQFSDLLLLWDESLNECKLQTHPNLGKRCRDKWDKQSLLKVELRPTLSKKPNAKSVKVCALSWNIWPLMWTRCTASALGRRQKSARKHFVPATAKAKQENIGKTFSKARATASPRTLAKLMVPFCQTQNGGNDFPSELLSLAKLLSPKWQCKYFVSL